MINRRLVVSQWSRNFHFSKWELEKFKKYFKEVVYHYIEDDPACTVIKKDDILFVYAMLGMYNHVKCHAKFGILYAGFGFQPIIYPEQAQGMEYIFDLYDAIFLNEGPAWEAYKHKDNAILVPPSIDPNVFKKTRIRTDFKKLIQAAGKTGEYKGRHISTEVFNLLQYDCELVPTDNDLLIYLPHEQMPEIYQNADGFLSPQQIGPAYVDAKYTASLCEAGMSGCIIFWHDCMKLGNSFETVFEISLNPPEIAQTIKDIVGSIDLEKHSILTTQEFYEKCNTENAIKIRIETMEKYL